MKPKVKISEHAEHALALLMIFGYANSRAVHLFKREGSLAKAAQTCRTRGGKFLKQSENARRTQTNPDIEAKTRDILGWCEQNGVGIITLQDKDYPHLLKQIYNPPLMLFYRGDLSVTGGEIPSISVVGRRQPSEYAVRVVEDICRELSGVGVTIVSGFAVGIDKAAMSAALAGGSPPCGVLACGIDVDYPKGSASFRAEIVEKGGLELSELLPGETVNPNFFASRNRVMSGLTRGLFIAECGEKSGCHLTADHAISQNRDIFCLPPNNVYDSAVTGNVRYLRDGATPVFSFTDILRAYKPELCEIIASNAADVPARRKFPEPVLPEKSDKPNASVVPPTAIHGKTVAKALPDSFYNLDKRQKAVCESLLNGAQTIDALAKLVTLSPSDLSDMLLELELDGLITNAPGNAYKLVT